LDAYGRGSKYEVGSREGIWWLPWQSVTDYLILTNSGDQALETGLVLYDSSGKPWQQKLSLNARETRRLSVRTLVQQAGLTGTFGGIKIDMAKSARFLDSTHLLFDESGKFSAIMKMFKHDPATTFASRSFGGVQEWTTRAPMLALSSPDPALGFPAGTTLQPKVFIRNASGKAFTAHLRFNWRAAAASGNSAPLELPFKTNETQLIDVAALQAQKLLPSDANWAAVILSAPILPEELLAVAASYDQTGQYGAQTPFSDQLATHWEGGKWEVDGTHNSLVTISNGGNKAARAQLTILYSQGSGQYQLEQTLAPDEQMALDFAKLIHDQVPDKNGHTLPLGLTDGTYRLLDLNDNPMGSLYEGKVIVDKTFGHAAYTCMICCGPNNPYMLYDPLSVLVNGSDLQGVQAINSCTNKLVDVTGDFPTWWTDNTSIATATSSAHQINGVAIGSTNHYAQSVMMYWGDKEDAPSCPGSQQAPGAGTNVSPQITSIDPDSATVGSNVSTVTINGSGFGSSPTVNLPQGVTVVGGQGSSDTKIILDNVAISINAPIGPNSMTVTAKGSDGTNQTSNQGGFMLDGPFYMTVLADQILKCSGCSTTVERDVTYQIWNFSNTNAGAIKIGENPVDSNWNCNQSDPGTLFSPCSAGYTTGSSGQFTDVWTLASDVYTPIGCGDNTDDHWMWCPTGRSIGHLSGYVHTNAISINGVVNPPNQFTAGTVINP
jgi:hypothetical protein